LQVEVDADKGFNVNVSRMRRFFPFNAEQTVNISSEFGPLVTMFVVNAIYGISAGTWALIITTVIAMIGMRIVLRRFPVFPVIASSITIVFGALTLLTGDPMWVQIKVTIFNAAFAMFLFGGLWAGKNFFKQVFGKTFHYTKQGWDKFTFSFAWFFVLTAILNEAVRLTFVDTEFYDFFGYQMDGVNIWILFKVGFIMPLSGFYAWYLTKLMQRYRIPEQEITGPAASDKARVRASKLTYATVEHKAPIVVP
jgi:intracellular septation protein